MEKSNGIPNRFPAELHTKWRRMFLEMIGIIEDKIQTLFEIDDIMKKRLIVVDEDILKQISKDIQEMKGMISEFFSDTIQNKKEYFDASEVKEITGWSDSTFRRFCKTVAIHKIKGKVYIHHSDIENLFTRKTILK